MSTRPAIEPFTTTGIGSLPHLSARQAAEFSLSCADIPFWPQLPKLSFKEGMVAQYSEGMPCLKMDEQKGALWVERNDEEIERFHESVHEGQRVSISTDYASGLYEFMRLIQARRLKLIKGHVTGPLTFTLGLTNQNGKPVYYDEEMKEIALMLLKAKVRWQIDLLRRHADGIIIFIDEPVISSLGGTAYMAVHEDESIRLLRELSDAIKSEGALSAVHCCGRAHWPMILKSGIDILNFDSYGFGGTLAIYPDEVSGFLDSGGIIAWGAVPTTEDISSADEQSLFDVFIEKYTEVSNMIKSENLIKNIMLTPSCGAGSKTVDEALKVFQLLMRLKESIKDRFPVR